jgi:hypothetical protein
MSSHYLPLLALPCPLIVLTTDGIWVLVSDFSTVLICQFEPTKREDSRIIALGFARSCLRAATLQHLVHERAPLHKVTGKLPIVVLQSPRCAIRRVQPGLAAQSRRRIKPLFSD